MMQANLIHIYQSYCLTECLSYPGLTFTSSGHWNRRPASSSYLRSVCAALSPMRSDLNVISPLALSCSSCFSLAFPRFFVILHHVRH